MWRFVGLGVLGLVLTAAAPAKEEPTTALRFCGVTQCRTVNYPSRVHLALAAVVTDTRVRPAKAAPYYTITHVQATGFIDESTQLYFVPSGGALRTRGIAEWLPLRGREGVFRGAVRGLRPFARPRVSRAEVNGRPARDPDSYLGLYSVTGESAEDPAGPEPISDAADNEQWSRYYDRVRRHWLPVNVWTSRPSPWGDGHNFVWVGRRLPLLRRDGHVVAIPGSLASCIRRAVSIRRCS